jgi:hypothetical protein
MIGQGNRHFRLDRYRGSRGQRNPSCRREGHRIHSCLFNNDPRNFAMYDAAVCFQAGNRCGMMAATIMTRSPGGGLARTVGQEQRGYQQDSDSRAVKYALHHVSSLALSGGDVPVMHVTRKFAAANFPHAAEVALGV